MKKIILMLMLLPNIVFAEVVYTDYEEYLRDTTIELEESDTLKKEEYYIYNTYQEELEEFYAPIEEFYEGYNIDYNNSIIKEVNSLENSIYSSNYQIKCDNNNNYKVDKIKFSNFSNNLNISEIKITNDKKSIGYGFGIQNYIGNKNFVIDKDLYGNTTTLTEETYININLYDYMNLEDIKIHLYFKEELLNETNFTLELNNYIYNIKFIIPYKEQNHIVISFDNNYSLFLEENEFKTTEYCISYHTLKIPNYYHSKINILPLNIYKQKNDIDKFLINDYKKMHNYYKREKIEIEDNINLENEQFNIEKYINTTIPLNELNVIEKINYEQTGIYPLKIYYKNNLLIEKDINYKVNLSNTESKTKEEKINIQKNNSNTSKKTNSNITTKIKTTKRKYSKKVTTTKTTNTTTKTELLKITNKINKMEKDSKKAIIIIISILIFLLIIFEIILLYVKRKYF